MNSFRLLFKKNKFFGEKNNEINDKIRFVQKFQKI